jgi:hypothetical protein
MRRLCTLTLIGAVCAMAVVMTGPSSAKNRSCGTFRAQGVKFAATVLRGAVTCAAARHVLGDFLSGKGKMHGPPNGPANKQTWTLDGWTCGHGAGGGACIRGGKTYKTARDWIEAQAR